VEIGVTCSDLKLPFSSTNTETHQMEAIRGLGGGAGERERAPQSVRAKHPETIHPEPSREFTSSMQRMGGAVNPKQTNKVSLLLKEQKMET